MFFLKPVLLQTKIKVLEKTVLKHIFVIVILTTFSSFVPVFAGVIGYHSPSLAALPKANVQNIGMKNATGSAIRSEMRVQRNAVSRVSVEKKFSISGGKIYTTTGNMSRSIGNAGVAQGYAAARSAISAQNSPTYTVSIAAAIPSTGYNGSDVRVAAKLFIPRGITDAWERALDHSAQYGDVNGKQWWTSYDGTYWYYTGSDIEGWFYDNIKDDEGNDPTIDEWEEFWEWFMEGQEDDNFLHRLPVGNELYVMVIMAAIYALKVVFWKKKNIKI